ncbi:anthranilate synthase component I family protein [Helicobacter sp. T3_23-1059]
MSKTTYCKSFDIMKTNSLDSPHIFPSFNEISKILPKLSKEHKKFPIYKELYADFITPIMAILRLKSHSKNAFLLESMQDRKQWGRYSFLGFEPSARIACVRDNICIESSEKKLLDLARFGKGILEKSPNKIVFCANPKEILREVLKMYKSPNLIQFGIKNIPSFSGGLVGYFAYDYIGLIEKKLDFRQDIAKKHTTKKADKKMATKDIEVFLFDSLIIFDNLAQKLLLLTNIDINPKKQNLRKAYQKGIKKLEEMQKILTNHTTKEPKAFQLDSAIKSYYDKKGFCSIVDKARRYIKEGDIFQVVLSNPLYAKARGSLFDVYRVLRTSNPSPYMFYLTSKDLEIAGASPETLLKLQNGTIYTYPLAGSRPRGNNLAQDEKLADELLRDEKELSEHNMLVDLGRNDIGKVAKIGSVQVEQYQNIVRYSHIMHISSRVSGILRDDKDAFSALDSIFPAGTLSGAPKIRACEIINELENHYPRKQKSATKNHAIQNRGIYGGAIGYLDFSGNMDMCIAIRLVVKNKNHIFVRSGAGIVYDSDGKKEYIETQHKAKAVINALKTASQNAQKLNAKSHISKICKSKNRKSKIVAQDFGLCRTKAQNPKKRKNSQKAQNLAKKHLKSKILKSKNH